MIQSLRSLPRMVSIETVFIRASLEYHNQISNIC